MLSPTRELAEQTRYLFADFATFDEKAAKKHLRPVAQAPLEALKQRLAALNEWQPDTIHAAIEATATQLDVGMGKVGMPLRVAVTGSGMSPAIDETVSWVGKARTLQRIDQALDFIAARVGD